MGYFKLIAVFDSLGKPTQQRRSYVMTTNEPSTMTSTTTTSTTSSTSSPGSVSSLSDERLASRNNSFEFLLTSDSELKTGGNGGGGSSGKRSYAEVVKKKQSLSSVGSKSKWSEVTSNKSNEELLSSTSTDHEKIIKPFYSSASEEVGKESLKKKGSIKSSDNIRTKKGGAIRPDYLSSFKYVAIVAGLILLGAIVYRQCRSSKN